MYATVIVALALIPFFLLLENRKLSADALVPVAVMTAIAVAGRAAFYVVPGFKPIVAVIVLTGAAFGAGAGFLTGSLSMLCSNLLFGHGPWTPWQMFALGLVGFISGFLGKTKFGRKVPVLAVWGLIAGFLFGIIMDTWFILAFNRLSPAAAGGALLLGLPLNAVLAGATVIFIAVFGKPFLKILERAKQKYGLEKSV